MRFLTCSFLLLGAALLVAPAAIASEQQPCPPGARCETPATSGSAASPDSALSLAILTHLGIATPTGTAGISVDFMPVRYVAIEAGAGTNLEGMEYEAGARLRLPVLNNARYLTLGAGWSEAMHYTGHEANGILGFGRIFESMAEGSISDAVWHHAHFLNTALGIETRDEHLLMRIYTGYAKMLNPGGYSCTKGDFACKPQLATGLVYLGVAFGYAF